MQSISRSAIAILALAMTSAMASPVMDDPNACDATGFPAILPLPSRTIFQLQEKPTWFENLAVGPNGDLFVTLLWPTASLYRIRAPGSATQKVDLIYTIESAQGLTGITAISPDTYVVAAANYSAIAQVVPGTGSLWSITVPAKGSVVAQKVTNVPESGLLNGLTTVPNPTNCHDNATTVLVSDSTNGEVFRVNTDTGKYDVAVKVPEMDLVSGSVLLVGVNGIKIHGHYLYWTNSDTTSIYRIAINAEGAAVAGAAVETVAHVDAAFLDDFTFDGQGDLWVATNLDNKIVLVKPDGRSEVAVGGTGDLAVAGSTAAQFGRGPTDWGKLYVTTSGANAAPVNGTITEPAKVVEVDVWN